LNEGENPKMENSAPVLFKKNEKGTWRILGKKPQGTKSHELMILDPCNSLDFTKLVWPILEQLKMRPIFYIQSTLNYGSHFWKLQKCSEVLKTLGNANKMAMPSLGIRGVHLQMEQNFKHLYSKCGTPKSFFKN